MAADSSTSPQLMNVQIDGVWHQFPKGTRVIEACEKAGSYVPRYCYHKKLSSPGNCRMCLIEMGMPKMGPDRKRSRVIEACEKAGSYVPRYCYHKKLSSPGNCRMCLIEMGMPKMGPDRK